MRDVYKILEEAKRDCVKEVVNRKIDEALAILRSHIDAGAEAIKILSDLVEIEYRDALGDPDTTATDKFRARRLLGKGKKPMTQTPKHRAIEAVELHIDRFKQTGQEIGPCIFKLEELEALRSNEGDAGILCDTTLTERFVNPECQCKKYDGNLGPCKTFKAGGNKSWDGPVHCAYCDHELICHTATITTEEILQLKEDLEDALEQRAREIDTTVNLATLLSRFIHATRDIEKLQKLREQARDFIQRKGLTPSPLRDEYTEETTWWNDLCELEKGIGVFTGGGVPDRTAIRAALKMEGE